MPDPNDSPSSALSKLDEAILGLLVERDELVKASATEDSIVAVIQENERLSDCVERVLRASGTDLGPDRQESLMQLMRHIASRSRESIRPHRVSFLGPEYSYSHLAAIKFFGDAAKCDPVSSIPAVFDAVHRKDATSGLVPIENSTDGRIVDTLGMFVKQHMQICGEVLLPIHHNLLSIGTREQIKQIHSKPQALSQCRGWLAANFPDAEKKEVSSTTKAAESASQDPSIAAVASLPAGRAYGLSVINSNIEDSDDNVTRFAVLGREETPRTGNDKTSLLFEVAHQPGALAQSMNVFQEAELNLTWIESFPAPGTRNEYLFFVELSGHRTDSNVNEALERLGAAARRLEVLGSYPVATLE